MKMIGIREMVQFSNDNPFLGLDVNISLADSQVGCCAARDAPNLAKNTNNKTPCNQMLKIATE